MNSESLHTATTAILVVDADPGIDSIIHGAVGHEHQAIHASSVDEALRLLQQHTVSVMLCNEYLDDKSGLVFMAGIRSKYPLLQLILMNDGVGEDLLTFAINDVGVLKYLKKPLIDKQVRQAIDTAHQHYQKAVEIEGLKAQHRKMTQEMRGLSYRTRRLRRTARLISSHSRDFLLASATAIVALQGLFLGLGLVVIGMLYVIKSMFGINVLEDMHLQDLLSN
jgi:DNA-binding NtrC family response regulator